MAHYSPSMHTSGSSSTSHSSLHISSHSLYHPASSTPERSQTLKPTKKQPRTPHSAQTLTQAFQNENHSSYTAGSGSNSNTPHTATVGGLRAQLHQVCEAIFRRKVLY